MVKIIILGAGQLGSYIYKNWRKSTKNDYQVDIVDFPEFDITDSKMIEDVVSRYDVIINAAAYTAVDKAESDQLKCTNINSVGPITIGGFLLTMPDKKFVHISSEVVYGSNDPEYKPLKETEEKTPTCVYSNSKKMADDYLENIMKIGLNNILILRSGWLFGPDNDHNFVEKIRQLLTSKEEIKVVNDQIGTMTFVEDIMNAAFKFIDGDLPGDAYNIGCDGYVSRYDVAKYVKEIIKSNCKIDECDSDEFKRVANVAKNSCLDCSKIKQFIPEFSDWREDVKNILTKEN